MPCDRFLGFFNPYCDTAASSIESVLMCTVLCAKLGQSYPDCHATSVTAWQIKSKQLKCLFYQLHLTQVSLITSSFWSCCWCDGLSVVTTCIFRQNSHEFSPVLNSLTVVHSVFWNDSKVWQPGMITNVVDIPAAANQIKYSVNNSRRMQATTFEPQSACCMFFVQTSSSKFSVATNFLMQAFVASNFFNSFNVSCNQTHQVLWLIKVDFFLIIMPCWSPVWIVWNAIYCVNPLSAFTILVP